MSVYYPSLKREKELYERKGEARGLLSQTGVEDGLALSIHDGFFASIFATLTGGVFLTGFALSLGATEFHIGILAAIPLAANLFQFLGAYLVRRVGRRTPISINATAACRTLWLLVLALPFVSPWFEGRQILWLVLLVIAISHFSGAISCVAWLSWISDLVPKGHLGRFFGRRNMAIGVGALAFSLLGGRFLDFWGKDVSGFQILFFMAVVGGVISVLCLRRIPEPPLIEGATQTPYHKALLQPLRDANFRRLLIFTFIWSFGVNFSAPFFVVYKLKELHLSYTFITILTSITVFSDLIGMRYWGRVTDRIGSRPVMLSCSAIAAFLPFGWLFTSHSDFSVYVLLPLLHVVGGFFWAGMNLASANMLFRLAPKEYDTVYFAVHSTVNGLSAALAALMGGVVAHIVSEFQLDLFFTSLVGLKIIYLFSWVLRFAAIPLLLQVNEPRGMSPVRTIRF